MPKNNESLNKELYSLLKTRGFDPIPKDASGETSPVPDEADVFKFTFKHDNQVKGTAYATIDGNNTLTVYYDDEVVSETAGGVDDVNMSWTNFLKYLKMWAQRRQMGFDLENKDHLHSDMAQRDYVKKQEVAESNRKLLKKGITMPNISEGYHAMGKTSSYNDSVPTVKIILQHTRQIQEGEQRYRNIARIYLENVQGERFLAPTNKPGIAQVYARHLAEGGNVNDERWNHLKSLCEEYGKMAGFVRAVRGNQFNESAQKLVEAGLNHYVSLRETLGKMRGHRGYNAYFESWTPTLMETEGEESNLNELFVQETLDPRIESVMPILNRLKVNLGEMKQVEELSEWADSLIDEATDLKSIPEEQGVAEGSDSVDQELVRRQEEYWNQVAKEKKDKEKAVLKAKQSDYERTPQGKAEKYWSKQGVAESESTETIEENNMKTLSGIKAATKPSELTPAQQADIKIKTPAYKRDKVTGKDIETSKEKNISGPEGLAALTKKLGQIEEDLGPEQKRVGQLGPTEKVNNNNIGKLVGANESVEQGVAEGTESELSKIERQLKYYERVAKEGNVKPALNAHKMIKKLLARQKELQNSEQGVAEGSDPFLSNWNKSVASRIEKSNLSSDEKKKLFLKLQRSKSATDAELIHQHLDKQGVAEGQEDLDALKKLMGK